MARRDLRLGAPAEEKVHPARPGDGAPRVLVEDEARERDPGPNLAARSDHGLPALHEGQRPPREQRRVRCHGAPARQRDPDASHRAFLDDPEEHVALVVVQDLPDLLRPLPEIPLDALHGEFLPRGPARIDQQLPDAAVGPPVGLGVAHLEARPVGQPDHPRSLDVEEEEVHGVRKPGDLEPPVLERPGPVDLLAAPVGYELSVLEPSDQPLVPVPLAESPQVNDDRIVGLAVDGVAVPLRPDERALQDRLVIAGKQDPAGRCAAGRPVDVECLPHPPLDVRRGCAALDDRQERLEGFLHVAGGDAPVPHPVDRALRDAGIVLEALPDGPRQGRPVQVVLEPREVARRNGDQRRGLFRRDCGGRHDGGGLPEERAAADQQHRETEEDQVPCLHGLQFKSPLHRPLTKGERGGFSA